MIEAGRRKTFANDGPDPLCEGEGRAAFKAGAACSANPYRLSLGFAHGFQSWAAGWWAEHEHAKANIHNAATFDQLMGRLENLRGMVSEPIGDAPYYRWGDDVASEVAPHTLARLLAADAAVGSRDTWDSGWLEAIYLSGDEPSDVAEMAA